MKRSFISKALILALTLVIFLLAAVSCGQPDSDGTQANKDALNEELALEITEQGDYTQDSYNAYLAKLAEAKAVAADEKATQEAVDAAVAALTEARLALTVRQIEETLGKGKTFNMLPGDTVEITISDYINANGLSGVSYEAKTSNAVASISPIADGKFTITAGDIRKPTDLKVSINALHGGAKKLTVELSIHISDDKVPTLVSDSVIKEYDLLDLTDKNAIIVDFSENVNNIGGLELSYAATCGDAALTLDGSCYSFALSDVTNEYAYTTFSVTVSYVANGVAGTLTFEYKLGVRDTSVYGVANGGFELGLDGWTIINTVGEAPFGGIDNKDKFWIQEFAMNNVGSYFSAYAEGAEEGSQGTLASPYFLVNSDYATYMLGGAGNPDVYITIENKAGKVLAIYRNTKFADLPEGDYSFEEQREMLGKTVFLANLVTYKVILEDFKGEEVRFVIHDHASSGWGVVFFDELITYYSSDDEIPEDATLAENLLANKAALDAELAKAIGEQGDYTKASFDAYVAKLEEARAIALDVAVSQEAVDQATAALSEARLALSVRPVEEISGKEKSFRLTSGDVIELLISDYVNSNGLTNITYTVSASGDAVTLSDIADGKFTVTAEDVNEATEVTVTLTVYYGGEAKLDVELSVKVTNDMIPILLDDEVVKVYDIYELANKENITLDLSENVYSAAGISLSYSVSYGGSDKALDGSVYTFTFGSYGEAITYEVITVTVSYAANGSEQSIGYTYKLGLKDTTANRLTNGGFENGLEGWDKVGNIGDVSSDTNYWVEEWENGGLGYEFGMDGEKMFSAYAPGAEEKAVGTLTSSTFKIGGSGFISFKLGAMKDGNYVYVDVVDASTKQILARYYNGLWAEMTDGVKSGCTLVAYKADLSGFIGKEVFLRISDNADSGYGLFFLDSFVTYYEAEPEGFNAATPVNYNVSGTIYDVFNGGFEMGDVQGWWNDGTPGHVTGAEAFFTGVAYGKDGSFLYSGVEDFEAGNGLEGNRGVLTSSTFEIGGIGYISFMLGGGENSLCYVQIIDATTGEILARYHQQAMQDAVLITYVADLSLYIGRTARVQVVDQATSGWGCVSFDNVVTYYASTEDLPEGLAAIDIKGNIKYTLENGSFETGDLSGWNMEITEAGSHNTLGWVLDGEIDREWYTKNGETKDGNYLFTFVLPDDTNCENTKGTLTSSSFSLKQGAFVSFKFGGAGNVSNHDVYVELCRADGSVIARFYNDAEGKQNTRMNSFYYQYVGVEVECFFRVVDNSTGDYGCFVVDDFRVNLEAAPEGYLPAVQ
ncbi:MAG: FIVAR domain-containing protein [Clostridia bacterium]|nr:FIVAR domain-containing protein [Clostridia bacterium]